MTVQPMVRAEGYELILGSSVDSQFGPVLLFGSGGQLVEVYKDRAIGLPPLNTTLARLLMERTKIFTALGGVRGRKPVDLAALRRAAGAVQLPGDGTELDQGDRHQSAARVAEGFWRSTLAWSCIPRTSSILPHRHPALSGAIRQAVAIRRRHGGDSFARFVPKTST